MDQLAKNKQEYSELVRIIAQEKEERDKVLGRIAHYKEELKMLGLVSSSDVKRTIANLEKEVAALQKQFDAKMIKFRERYGNKLQKIN